MLSDIPVIPHFFCSMTTEQRSRISQVAERVRMAYPELKRDERFRAFIPQSLPDGPCLHLDDLSEIHLAENSAEFVAMQERARLRAGHGDLVAAIAPDVDGYENYCRNQLGLGSVDWIHPKATENPLRVAHACWEDRSVRHELIHRLRTDALMYLHLHMGTVGGWELAELLQIHSRRPLKVIGPPPALTQLVNNKVAFTQIVEWLLGPEAVPQTFSAWNSATLSKVVSEFPDSIRTVGVKRPNSAGGMGIVILEMAPFRGRSLQDIHDLLMEALAPIHWDDGSELLLGAWEDDVLCSPSVQMWLPPTGDGMPVIEGIFAQHMRQGTAEFDGTTAANLPESVGQRIADQAWQIACLFQQLGYIGRCSVDTILAGSSLSSARIEFIECNGRWGGTSAPMTLMNRLFGDWCRRPFAARSVSLDGLRQVTFQHFLNHLGDHAYDQRTGQGHFILFVPGRMRMESTVGLIVVGNSYMEVDRLLKSTFPELLATAVSATDSFAQSLRPKVC